MSEYSESVNNTDPAAPDRKSDHIQLAFKSKVGIECIDNRFSYEPLLAAHPSDFDTLATDFLGCRFSAPIWVSSMTGGTALAKIINRNLATACGEYGLGMGLGSCRQLLYSDEFLPDFQVRKYIKDQPLYANLGVAQLEQLIQENAIVKIRELLNKLEANGLIIHVNPMQEWLQPEGDRFKYPAIDTIKRLLDVADYPVIVKEVGQGMGVKSLDALLSLPVDALDFGASGGTNFALLEILRSSGMSAEYYAPLANVGHSAEDMIDTVNALIENSGHKFQCRQVIISGGVSNFLDGYYYMSKLSMPSIYGQAAGFLKHAMESYESLQEYVEIQIKGLALAKAFLKVK